MMDGLICRKTSYPMPSSSIFPGIKLSTLTKKTGYKSIDSGKDRTHTMSDFLARSKKMARPFSCLRLSEMDFLLRLMVLK